MGIGNVQDQTQYEKKEMLNFADQLEQKIKELDELRASLKSNITEVGQNWNMLDSDAAAIYNNFQEKGNKYDLCLITAQDAMCDFYKQLTGQESKYEIAESEVRKATNAMIG